MSHISTRCASFSRAACLAGRSFVGSAVPVLAALLVSCGGGGDGSSNPAGNGTSVPQFLRGQFVDAPVGGLNYVTPSTSGTTDAHGFFNYSQTGEEVQFFVGAVPIGRAQASPTVHVFDLSATLDELASGMHTKVAQLLQSLDTNASKSSTILLPADIASRLADPAAINFTANQLVFDDSLKGALEKVGTTTPIVSASVAKENAASYASESGINCTLQKPLPPDAREKSPYVIKTGPLTCLDWAKVNFFVRRIDPLLAIQINSAGEQIEQVEKSYSDEAVQAALDASPFMAGLMGIDAAVASLEAGEKERAVLAALSAQKILTATARASVDGFIAFSPSDGKVASDAARANQYIGLIEKAIDTLGSTTTCVGYIWANGGRKLEDRSGCYKGLSQAIEAYKVSLELPLFNTKTVSDQTAINAGLDAMADGMAGIGSAMSVLSKASGSDAKLRRAVFGLTGAGVKMARDTINLFYVSKGQGVPTTGWSGFTVQILDNVATPVLAVASKCYGVAKSTPTDALACIATGTQEVLKSSTQLAFRLVGAFETIRATSYLNEAIVTKAFLSELLWAGQANAATVYAKYGVAYTPDIVQSRRKSEIELVKQIGSKRQDLVGVEGRAEWTKMLWAATWDGKNSFSIEDVIVSVHQYLNMIKQNTSPDIEYPALKMSGSITSTTPTCTIASSANSCNVTLNWMTVLPVSTSGITSNIPIANTPVASGNSGSKSVSVPYGVRTFYLYNNKQELATSQVTAACVSGTSWNGSQCQAANTSGTLTSSAPSCTIVTGASNCNVTLNWNTTNPVSTSSITWDYPAANSILANGNSGGPLVVSVPRGSRVVYLYNNSLSVTNLTVTADCAPDAAWNGSACQAAAMSGTLTPAAPTCTIPAGSSSCNVTLSWSTSNPVNVSAVTSNKPNANTPIGSGNAGSISAAVLYPSRSFFLINNQATLQQLSVNAACASGSAWNTTTGSCVAPATGAPIAISSVSVGQANNTIQTITILGSNFSSTGLEVDLLDNLSNYYLCCGSGARPPTYVSNAQITIHPNFGFASGAWQVRVRTSTGTSSYHPISVTP